eukprot:CAMPEP_0115626254 /NCGR_PEP_ID=MMETSP0272-20121206/28245_1 /TAXON_ID=71861 /ORGANISM="Scrippsiella trochoidea, Strain CCMP3099" /LENGTH=288 /DNA_ID=CAMNT_0003062595 /DNA_START=69 /DNA_END=932 /DNA_ORIENTATION=-
MTVDRSQLVRVPCASCPELYNRWGGLHGHVTRTIARRNISRAGAQLLTQSCALPSNCHCTRAASRPEAAHHMPSTGRRVIQKRRGMHSYTGEELHIVSEPSRVVKTTLDTSKGGKDVALSRHPPPAKSPKKRKASKSISAQVEEAVTHVARIVNTFRLSHPDPAPDRPRKSDERHDLEGDGEGAHDADQGVAVDRGTQEEGQGGEQARECDDAQEGFKVVVELSLVAVLLAQQLVEAPRGDAQREERKEPAHDPGLARVFEAQEARPPHRALQPRHGVVAVAAAAAAA